MRILRLALLAGLLLACEGVGAQVRNVALKGYMAIEGGETFTYRLQLHDSLGIITGYSILYAAEGKDVKTAITGSLDRQKRQFSFQESQILYNHNFESNAILCLVNATLKQQQDAGGITLSGPLTSSTSASVACSRGSISFANEVEIKELFSNAAPAIDTAAKAPVAVAPKPKPKPAMKEVYVSSPTVQQPAAPAGPVVTEITSGSDKAFEWTSDTIVLQVWDGGHIDDDVISILYNDRPVLGRYKLTADRKELHLPVSTTGTDVITILAENEGNEPPNTANLLLLDGATEHPVVAYNKIGREAIIRVRKAKK